MASIYARSASVNTAADHEREFLTKALNSAIARARLTVNSLEAIAASLRHKQQPPPKFAHGSRMRGLRN